MLANGIMHGAAIKSVLPYSTEVAVAERRRAETVMLRGLLVMLEYVEGILFEAQKLCTVDRTLDFSHLRGHLLWIGQCGWNIG